MAKYRAPLLNNDVIHLIEQNKEPEQKLWIAVLAKAFDDAFYCTDDNAALDALRWIKHGLDFNYVCQLAGRDPNYVRRRMLDKVIDRGDKLVDINDKAEELQLQAGIFKKQARKTHIQYVNIYIFHGKPYHKLYDMI